MKLKTRFAPTPSGYLHLGNAWSFVLTWLVARSEGGNIHLRIDDLDAARFRDEYLEDIFETLNWLGLDWDSGPRDANEFKASFSQRRHLTQYLDALELLLVQRNVYACACSREQVRRDAEAAGVRVYPGTCRAKALDLSGEEHTLRFRVSTSVRVRNEVGKAFELHPVRDMGDFVLRQKNGDPSYQLASVLDDEKAGINFVVRGLDLMPSTGGQINLADALGLDLFPQARFWHHALMVDDAGGKLSKSASVRPFGSAQGPPNAPTKSDAPAESIRALREKFSDPKLVYRFFARHLGMESEQIFFIQDLLNGFRMEKVATMPIRLSDFWREIT